MLTLSKSLVAAADKRPGDMQAALEHAAELAQHTGEGNAYWMGFGRAVAIAEGLRPEVHPNRPRRAAYWLDYGRALARVRGRHDDAVMAFHRVEAISPVHLHRNPWARDTLAKLVARSRRDGNTQ
jgi:hypothetical protein